MRKTLGRPAILYPLAGIFILGWWLLTLIPEPIYKEQKQSALNSFQSEAPTILSPYLRPIARAELQQALVGDYQRMLALITEWEAEALLLQVHGIGDVRRLTPDQYLKAQLIGRRLLAQERGESLPTSSHELMISDDLGIPLGLSYAPQRFLPQTELAATVLLALTTPERIVALPSRLRWQGLFSSQLLDRIPLDIDRYNSEKLFLARPDVAFVAHYTQPSVIETLRNQEIAQFMLTRMSSVTEVQQTICKIGHVIGCSEKAELLTIFMEAGFAALDNRLVQAKRSNDGKVVYLNYYTQFSVPTDRHLIGQLVRRLGINRSFPTVSDHWQVVYDSEQIANLAPDVIIVSTAQDSYLVNLILSHPVLQRTPAVQLGHVYAVDETVQQSPTQFLLLAYYDLAEILLL